MRDRYLALLVVVAACSSPRTKPDDQVTAGSSEVAGSAAPADAAAAMPSSEGSGSATAETGAKRSWVGVRIDNESLRITQVIKDAPGDRAGLRIGDKLVSIAAEPVTTVPQFVERVSRTKSGDKVAIVVERGGGRIAFDVIVAPRPDSPAQSTLVGKPAPELVAKSLSGSFGKLSELRGNVVLVDFWATWCGPCTFTIPRLNRLHEKYASQGLRIVGLSSEEPDVIKAFVAKANIGYAIAHDPDDKIAGDYLREGIPMFVVIDKAGIVRNVIVGADVDAIDAAVIAQLVK